MGFFKFFNKTRKQQLWIEGLGIDTKDWKYVFSACLGKMMAIQTACSEQVVKEEDWQVNFEDGTIAFGTQKYPLQFIGTEASSDNSWMWAWNNINGFSEDILQLAEKTKEIGKSWNLTLLTIEDFIMNDIFNGHNISIVTCGIADRYCYYRCTHDHGAAFIAFSGVPDSVFAPVDSTKFIFITTQCIQQFDIDHKTFVEGFLLWNNTKYEWHNNTIIAHFPQELKIEFEQNNDSLRISSIKSDK